MAFLIRRRRSRQLERVVKALHRSIATGEEQERERKSKSNRERGDPQWSVKRVASTRARRESIQLSNICWYSQGKRTWYQSVCGSVCCSSRWDHRSHNQAFRITLRLHKETECCAVGEFDSRLRSASIVTSMPARGSDGTFISVSVN